MSKYNNTVITKAGLALITAAGSGQAGFKITKAETTATDLSTTDLSTLTAIPDVVQTGSIVGSDNSTVGVLGIKVQFDNTHVSKSYSANAIGVYATGADGKQILYAVTTAETGHAQYIPDYAGGVKLDFGITINVVIGAATNVTVQFDTDGLATIGFVEDAVAGLTNVAKTDTANSFTKVQTLAGGAVDGKGNAYATTKDVATGLNNGLSTKVTDNKDGTEQLNGVQVQPFNKLSDTIGGRNLLLGTSSVKGHNSSWENIINVDVTNLVGTTLTYSAILDITDSKQGRVGVNLTPQDSSGKPIGNSVPSNSVNWGNAGKVTATITIPAGASILSINERTNNTDQNPHVGSRKLEQGSIATDWTPAPEDKVNVADMRKPASDVAGIDEVSTLQTQVDNSAVGTNLLINTSSSSTNRQTMMQGTSPDIQGVYSRTDSYEQIIAPSSGELFYRFMKPDTNNLYGLTPGETYTISGSASYTLGELNFRAQYSTNGSDWNNLDFDTTVGNYLGIPVSDGSVFTPFSHTFTIPVGSTGVYLSLENFGYTTGSLFRFKNMKLEKGSVATDWCPNPSEILTKDEVADAKAAAITQALNDAKAEIAKLPKHVTLTQAQFDALATKDANTYYYITEG